MRRAEWSIAEANSFYGFNLADGEDRELLEIVEDWATRQGLPFRKSGNLNRHVLERFFAMNRVLPKGWMALKLGMKSVSLDSLLLKLSQLQWRAAKFHPISL
jgi:hypothetical protein